MSGARKPGNVTIEDRHYRTDRATGKRVPNASAWTTGPDGKPVPTVKRWRVRWTDMEGKQRSQSFDRKSEAVGFADDVRDRLRKGVTTDPRAAAMTVAELGKVFLAMTGRAPSTVASYRSIWENHVIPTWGTTPVRSVTHTAVTAWVSQVAASGKSAATVRKAHVLLDQVLELAVRDGRITSNPARGVKLPKLSGPRTRYLTPTEVEKVALEADRLRPGGFWGELIRFACYSGLRAGELAGLRVSDVDVEGGIVRVRQAYTEVGGELVLGLPKGDKTRDVNVKPERLERLSPWLDGKDATALVFSQDGTTALRRSNWAGRVLTPAAEAAGLAPLTPHDLRHTFASIAASRKTPIQAVSKWLGHGDISITARIYTHLFPEDLSAAAALL
ncbi:site-specific integrase [Skermania sp. ID1734]|uniref:tyrosine-type recombinase/integrase n=1 Tax=Skermania sp. ID1734 TaxID=2597516 RepID=UPI00117D7E63|nr:site-specific integrase [Skermania sp. ID1734]TSE00575.1 site-specific integrase [Skermania sp. ID1734]